MLILHSSTPDSILKAYMLMRIHKCKSMHVLDYRATFFKEAAVDADKFSLAKVYSDYKEEYGVISFFNKGLDKGKADALKREIFFASRFKDRNKWIIIFKALDQAVNVGFEYVMSKVSKEAKEFRSMANQVKGEIHRAQAFIRFEPDDEKKVMIGRAKFENDIADLVLMRLAKRYPGYKIVLLSDSEAFVYEDSKIYLDETGKYGFTAERKKDFDEFWEMYYNGQYIESRRNRRLAISKLPKKYWEWVSEGEKIEKGIPKTTLENFAQD